MLHVLRWCQYHHCHVGEGSAAPRTQVVLALKALRCWAMLEVWCANASFGFDGSARAA
jgi:hypothetical protein